jgi:hypothetical protein
MSLTFVVWYLIVGFVRWEFDWVKHLAETTTMNRVWFFLCVVAKIVIDYILWRYVKEDDRKEEDQKTYIYED